MHGVCCKTNKIIRSKGADIDLVQKKAAIYINKKRATLCISQGSTLSVWVDQGKGVKLPAFVQQPGFCRL